MNNDQSSNVMAQLLFDSLTNISVLQAGPAAKPTKLL